MAHVDSFGNVIPTMRKGRAGLLAGIARSRKKAPAFAKQCKRKVAPRTLLVNKAAMGATAAASSAGTTKLYMWGYDYYGRLGQGLHLGPKDELKPDSCPQCEAAKNQCIPTPTLVRAFDHLRVHDIATGAAHTAAITTDGRLFTWGKCHQGQTGHGTRWGPTADCCVDWPRIVVGPLATLRVTFVAAGVSHVIAGTMAGVTFTWGAGEWGQLGHGDAKGKCRPTALPSFGRVTQAAAGWHHTIFVVGEGDGGAGVWGCGSNKRAQLGVTDIKRALRPVRIHLDGSGGGGGGGDGGDGGGGGGGGDAVCVSAARSTVIGQTTAKAQKQDPKETRKHTDETDQKQLQQVPGGLDSQHGGAAPPSATNTYHQTATASPSGCAKAPIPPTPPSASSPSGCGLTTVRAKDVLTVTSVSCGYFHTVVVSNDNRALAWGANEDGQCAVPPCPVVPSPRTMEGGSDTASASCGEGFTVLLGTDGRLRACGKGQFGALGRGDLVSSAQVREVLFASPEHEGTVFTHVAAGQRTLIAAGIGKDQKIRIFGCGANQSGQIGKEHGSAVTTLVERKGALPHGYKLSQLNAGTNHCTMLVSK